MESPLTVVTAQVSTQVKATAGQRFLAAFIDGIIGSVPAILIGIISYELVMLGQLVAIAYFFTKDTLPAFNGFLGGQSVGKKLMGIKVVKEDTGAGIVGDYGTGIVRQVSLMIPFFNLVDACMVFTDEGKRFGDKWAKTIVVKA